LIAAMIHMVNVRNVRYVSSSDVDYGIACVDRGDRQ
jgi:hypothetical protein